MFKKAFFILAVAAFVTTAVYAAPNRTGKVDLGVNVSAAIPDDDETEDTVYVGGNLSYGVTEWLGVGFSGGWMEFEDDDFNTGELSGVPLFGDILLRIPIPDQPIQPYGVVGLGAILWDFDESAALKAANVEAEVDDAFAVKVGGGVDWFINDNWILNFEVSYLFSDSDTTARNTVTGASATVNDVETDTLFVGGGVKYLFS